MTQENLIKNLSLRDEKAFVYIMDKYSKLLWKVACDILKDVCCESDIEECISDVYFKLWQNPQAFDHKKSNLKNYMVMMTRCHAIDIYRKKVNHPESELADNIIDSKNDPADIVICQEKQDELQKALNKLSSGDKEIITRRYLQDEKPSEISEKMNLPVRNIENRLYRAKLSLKKILSSYKTS